MGPRAAALSYRARCLCRQRSALARLEPDRPRRALTAPSICPQSRSAHDLELSLEMPPRSAPSICPRSRSAPSICTRALLAPVHVPVRSPPNHSRVAVVAAVCWQVVAATLPRWHRGAEDFSQTDLVARRRLLEQRAEYLRLERMGINPTGVDGGGGGGTHPPPSPPKRRARPGSAPSPGRSHSQWVPGGTGVPAAQSALWPTTASANGGGGKKTHFARQYAANARLQQVHSIYGQYLGPRRLLATPFAPPPRATGYGAILVGDFFPMPAPMPRPASPTDVLGIRYSGGGRPSTAPQGHRSGTPRSSCVR